MRARWANCADGRSDGDRLLEEQTHGEFCRISGTQTPIDSFLREKPQHNSPLPAACRVRAVAEVDGGASGPRLGGVAFG
jgi:hypothetical protein